MSKLHSVSTVAPHRVSLVGGGTDLPSISNLIGGGCISFTIPKYIFVTCKWHSPYHFQERYRLQYSSTEVVGSRADIVNDIIRETLIYLSIDEPLVISVSSDLPSGSGLGSSSSFTVALLLALKTLFGLPTNSFELAEDAYQIEHKINGDSVGRQDQFAAAVGGLNYYQFSTDGSTSVSPIFRSIQQLSVLTDSSLLIWTGLQRSASSILSKQAASAHNSLNFYQEMNSLTERCYSQMKATIITSDDLSTYIRSSWDIKKRLSSAIVNSQIDSIINLCLDNGTKACKVLGAGGGGYVLALGTNVQTRSCINSLGLQSEPLGYDPNGARVLSTFQL